jgi:hypothetical protein
MGGCIAREDGPVWDCFLKGICELAVAIKPCPFFARHALPYSAVRASEPASCALGRGIKTHRAST